MKKLLSLVVALALVLSCSAALASESVTLVYAEVNPIDSLMGQTAQVFKDKVEELTNGSVTVDIQASGVLGDEAAVLDTIMMGGDTVDIARVATFSMTNYGVKKTVLLSVPYTFTGREHFWAFAGSELGTEFLNEDNDLGAKGLFYVEEGFRHFFFKDAVAGIDDLAGKKLRVSNDPIMTGMVNGLKANPTVVAFGELYQSLSSGVVDGAEQPIVNYQSNAFHEVAPYMLLDGHTLGCAEVIITDNAWGKLSAEQQEAVIEAGKAASEFNAAKSAEIEAQCMDELKAAGVTFVDVADKTVWQEACADIISQYTEGLEAEYQAIQDMAK